MQSISIHIGLNEVDPTHYGGWRGALAACEHDAHAMAALAESQGIATRISLLTRHATYARVVGELATAAAVLRRGDYLLLTFAGHGASFDDIETPGRPVAVAGDEDDGKDEAWALHDGYLLDDELHDALCRFAAGVRVCVVSDSCFSGTVTRGRANDAASCAQDRNPLSSGDDELPGDLRERRVEPVLANALYRRSFAAVYLPRSDAARATRNLRPAAHVVLLAGCKDDQTVLEDQGHGRFTRALLSVWNAGQFAGSHHQLIHQIQAGMPNRQTPQLYVTGDLAPSFVNGRPFTPAL